MVVIHSFRYWTLLKYDFQKKHINYANVFILFVVCWSLNLWLCTCDLNCAANSTDRVLNHCYRIEYAKRINSGSELCKCNVTDWVHQRFVHVGFKLFSFTRADVFSNQLTDHLKCSSTFLLQVKCTCLIFSNNSLLSNTL